MSDDTLKREPRWLHLAWAIGGAAAGSWWTRKQIETAKKSKAEVENPDEAEEVYREIGDLLDEWEPDSDCESEEEFTQDLAEYMEANTEWDIEKQPNTPEGRPDILVGDLLALELKVNPSKAERDRLVGQCTGYSRMWMTWIVIIDVAASVTEELEKLLKDKGLQHIEVWRFS